MSAFVYGTAARMLDAAAKRGPRYFVYGTIRPGEMEGHYCDTGEQAERLRQEWEHAGRYTVHVNPPVGSVDLKPLADARRKAIAELDEATSVLRAAVLRALEDGRAEAEVARAAGVDRMTVRAWSGKR